MGGQHFLLWDWSWLGDWFEVFLFENVEGQKVI